MAEHWSIPLVLRAPSPGRLELALPAWYRWMMAAILGLIVAALAQLGHWPGVPGWILLGLVAAALLYLDRWTFDAVRGRAVHRGGLLIAARTLEVPFPVIERFRIVPHLEGATAGRFQRGKPFLALVMECADGTAFLIDRVHVRRAARLRAMASRLAEVCGKPLAVAEP